MSQKHVKVWLKPNINKGYFWKNVHIFVANLFMSNFREPFDYCCILAHPATLSTSTREFSCMLSSSGQVFIVTTKSLDTRKPHAIVTIMFRGCGYAFTS